MEIQTTIRELPEKIRNLKFSPETTIRLIIHEQKTGTQRKRPYLPFLDSEVWDGDDTPEDLSANIDYYLYDLDKPHG